MRDPEIGDGHVPAGHDLGGLALREHAALIEHDDAIRQRDHDTHHVLDEHDRRAARANAADQLDRVVDFGGRQPGEYFVEQQEAGAGGERTRELEELRLVQIELAGEHVGARFQARESEPFGRSVIGMRAVERGAAEHRRERDVVADAKMGERPRHLVGSREPCVRDPVRRQADELVAREAHAATVRRVMAACDVDERGFAGSVRSQHAEDLAFAHVEVDAVERAHALERLAQVLHDEKRRGPRRGSARFG
jgi:hypothetical protein